MGDTGLRLMDCVKEIEYLFDQGQDVSLLQLFLSDLMLS